MSGRYGVSYNNEKDQDEVGDDGDKEDSDHKRCQTNINSEEVVMGFVIIQHGQGVVGGRYHHLHQRRGVRHHLIVPVAVDVCAWYDITKSVRLKE